MENTDEVIVMKWVTQASMLVDILPDNKVKEVSQQELQCI